MKSIKSEDQLEEDKVAPCAGAWIEILWTGRETAQRLVAPCAGAWIEMLEKSKEDKNHVSPPARGRGLKYPNPCGGQGGKMSPPARGRGLKFAVFRVLPPCRAVAPCAGAWIEIH